MNYSLSQFSRVYHSKEDAEIVMASSENFLVWLKSMQLPEQLIDDLKNVYIPVINLFRKEILFDQKKIPLVGISGSQGSGKSTFTSLLSNLLEETYGFKVVTFSIDDFYFPHVIREKLSKTIHPLLITRGVPGTHNVENGINVINNLRNADQKTITRIPVFDKSTDDQKPPEEWEMVTGRPDIILFEGWCVGANPEPEENLIEPVNEFEKINDSDQSFRRFVNDKLKNEYKLWFSEIDFLIMLKIESFDQVYDWRCLQERKLRDNSRLDPNQKNQSKIMSENELLFFISHYERITKYMLKEMPSRSNLILEISKSHRIERIGIN